MKSVYRVGASLAGRWGLDGVQLAALVRAQRRPVQGTAASARRGAQPRSRWRTVTPYVEFAQFVVPGLVGVAGIFFPSFFLGLTFSYTFIMLMFGLPFLGHCTTVLLDTSENRILMHLPISGRTLLTARLINILKHASYLIFAISLPTAIAIAARFGAVALLIFVISLVLTLIFLVTVSLAVCLLALRTVDPARIRSGILWFQTTFFILAIALAGLVLTDASFVKIGHGVTGAAWWYFYPPGWMAGLMDFSLMGKTSLNVALAATALIAPLVGLVGCFQLLSGGHFSALLSNLEAPHSRAVTPRRFARWRVRLAERVSSFMNGNKQERAVFDMTSRLIKSDSILKLQIFPYIGTTLLFCIGSVAMGRYVPMSTAELFLYCYMPVSLAISVRLIQYSQDSAAWRAAWCYHALPFAKPGVPASGAMKAYICRYVLPIYLVLLAAGMVFWGTTVALNTLLALAVVILLCIHSFWGAAPSYSRDPMLMTQSFGRLGNFIFFPLAIGLIAGHIALAKVAGNWGVAAGIAATSVGVFFALRTLRSKEFRDRTHESTLAT